MKKIEKQANTFTEIFLIQPPQEVIEIRYCKPLSKEPTWSAQWRLWQGYNTESICIWSVYCPYRIGDWVKEINPILVDGCWSWKVTTRGVHHE